MQTEENKSREIETGEMKKRRETMADGKRYIVYYTFEKPGETAGQNEEKENV